MIKRLLHALLRKVSPWLVPDRFARRFPVSVKGIIADEIKGILLLQNERGEWDLPGGKLDANESLEECVVREIKEELNADVRVLNQVQSSIFRVYDKVDVLLVVYNCQLLNSPKELKISFEHGAYEYYNKDGIQNLSIANNLKQLLLDYFLSISS